MRVLVITNNLRQASYRLRIESLIPAMKARGVDWIVEVRPRAAGARRQLLRGAADFDATILQRKLLESGDARLLRAHARRLYFDVDDAVMFGSPSEGWIGRLRGWRRFKATARRVDHVVAGNSYLAELFTRHGAPSASVIPTVVDAGRYVPSQRPPDGHVTLIWIGSASTLPYLSEALPYLKAAVTQVPGLKLKIVADTTLQSDKRLPIEYVPWSVENELSALASSDIGIAPMAEDRWTLGKCGFKLLQYMAAGLPTIASPVGANASIIVNEESGLLASNETQWIKAIFRLAGDEALRRRLGEAARLRVETHYSVVTAADAWSTLLQSKT